MVANELRAQIIIEFISPTRIRISLLSVKEHFFENKMVSIHYLELVKLFVKKKHHYQMLQKQMLISWSFLN
jgi:hypothetical protein